MKKSIIPQLIIVLLIPALILSCDKENGDEPIDLIPELDGLYVYGTNTVAETAVEQAAKMSRALMNPDKTGGESNVEGIYGKLMHIGGNSTIQFTEVTDDVSADYGAPDGGETVPGGSVEHTDITDDMIYGTLVEDEEPIAISAEGLYYVFVNMNNLEYRILKVNAQMIGDATELQWTAGTPLPQKSSSVDSTVFEGTEITLVGASGYKYRFGDGWELYNDGTMATFTHLGVESYGTAWETGINDIGYFQENIPHKENGVFTVRLKYNAESGEWDETKVKTGNILQDYTDSEMGLFGNAYLLAPGDTANWVSGEDGYGLHTPDKSGYVYTWTWDDTELLQDREFIFLENGAWGGLQFDWSMLSSVEGPAIDDGDIVDATTVGGEYHNFYVVAGGTYDISLVIDAETDISTVTITGAE